MRTELQIKSDLKFAQEALQAARKAGDYQTLHGFERYNEAVYIFEKLELELAQLEDQQVLLALATETSA